MILPNVKVENVTLKPGKGKYKLACVWIYPKVIHSNGGTEIVLIANTGLQEGTIVASDGFMLATLPMPGIEAEVEEPFGVPIEAYVEARTLSKGSIVVQEEEVETGEITLPARKRDEKGKLIRDENKKPIIEDVKVGLVRNPPSMEKILACRKTEGLWARINLNAKWLYKLAEALGNEEVEIRFNISDPSGPVEVRPLEGEAFGIIMPMHIGSNLRSWYVTEESENSDPPEKGGK